MFSELPTAASLLQERFFYKNISSNISLATFLQQDLLL